MSNFDSKYRKIEILGKGGNGDVFRVKEKSTEEEYALKLLHKKGRKDASERFKQEINIHKAAYKVSSNNVIPIIDSSSESPMWYTMPIATPVFNYIKNNNLSVYDIIEKMIKLCIGLENIHGKGIFHRDIKPDNILYYKNEFCLSDFGLGRVGKNGLNLTKENKPLGPIFTIAPEMKRTPVSSAGDKADVYSFAKTLWMLITGDNKGFDGKYDYKDNSYGLRYQKRTERLHLVELEKLLHDATNNIPELRPSMGDLSERLSEYLNIASDIEKSQESEWNFFLSTMQIEKYCTRKEWESVEGIIEVINKISGFNFLNHMFLPSRGGFDFVHADKSPENGCIYIYCNPYHKMVVKPKTLYFENFKEEYYWSYFVLELNEIKFVLSDESNVEVLVEDMPGHYCPVVDNFVYGVYDYDSGKPLPQGACIVSRYTSGKIMIVPKFGKLNYEKNIDMYSGVHNKLSVHEIRCLVKDLIDKNYNSDLIKKMRDFEERTPLLPYNSGDMKYPDKFIEDNFDKFEFTDIVENSIENSDIGNARFFFTFDKSCVSRNFGDNTRSLFLGKNGFIISKEICSDELYCVYNRKQAIEIFEKLRIILCRMCKEKGYAESINEYWSIYGEMKNEARVNFSKESIKELMKSADDRFVNQMVIDEFGYANIVQKYGETYPVRLEKWAAGNNYVGKYSELNTLDYVFNCCKRGFCHYIKTGKFQYVDFMS